jgi:hypothetical protein
VTHCNYIDQPTFTHDGHFKIKCIKKLRYWGYIFITFGFNFTFVILAMVFLDVFIWFGYTINKNLYNDIWINNLRTYYTTMYAPFSKSNFHRCGPFHFYKELYLVYITLIYDFQTLSMKPLTIRIKKNNCKCIKQFTKCGCNSLVLIH